MRKPSLKALKRGTSNSWSVKERVWRRYSVVNRMTYFAPNGPVSIAASRLARGCDLVLNEAITLPVLPKSRSQFSANA